MANSFAGLKKNRAQNFDKLKKELDEMSNQGYSNNDDDFWKLEVDKAGNGYAVIRFLPAPAGEEKNFVRLWDHGFQGPGGWYIENSLTTLGQDDPVSEYNSKLWNNGTDAGKEQARKQKRRLYYFANIYVVRDPANPDNEGKVFKYKFGAKIYDKINAAMVPEFEDETAIDPVDMWDGGANFKLKARKGDGGYRTYEASTFDAPGTMVDPDGNVLDDNQLEEIYNSMYSLSEIVDPKNFKSYDELKAKLYKVLGLDGQSHAPTTTAEDDDSLEDDYIPDFGKKEADAIPEASSPEFDVDDDDDDMEFFKGLAND